MKTKSVEQDYSNLGFAYRPAPYRFVSNFEDGAWQKGSLSTDATIMLNESAGVFQYAQTIFEGLKAYTTEDGRIVTFRPDMNAKRMQASCERCAIPILPSELFLEAISSVISKNKESVPPYGFDASLYIRPYIMGTEPILAIRPCETFQFRTFATPVSSYFTGGIKSLSLRVCEYDRAAPKGTGHIKAGLNYAMSLKAIVTAHDDGFDENMYLDAKTRTKVEETGGANFLFITKDKKLVSPKSDTILSSITRNSLFHVAKEYLGLEVEEREVLVSELKDFVECGLCGTAAVISPVGKVLWDKEEIVFSDSASTFGPVLQKLYDTLISIQHGKIEAPKGWIVEIE